MDARLRAGFRTPDDAAKASGLSRDFIYKLERIGNKPNAANPTLDTLEKLADLYGRELGDLFPSTQPRAELAELVEVLMLLPLEERAMVVEDFARMGRRMARFAKSAPDVEAPHEAEPIDYAALEAERRPHPERRPRKRADGG